MWNHSFDERMNILSHALGCLFSVLGALILLGSLGRGSSFDQVFSFTVFSLSLIALYLASTLYHSAHGEDRRRRLKYLDHSAIYLLIAGTYTPYCLLAPTENGAGTLLIAVWALAFIGIIGKIFLVGRFKLLSTLIYLAMGWLVAFRLDLLAALPRGELYWLIAGGLSYSLGTIFYMWRSLRFGHAIWHLFVLGGSVCHYMGVYLYLR